MSADEIYNKVKTEFDRLERDHAPRGEWIQFANRLVDAVMKCQAIVIEHQKRLIAHARGEGDGGDYKATSQASRDAIQILDNLSALHERARSKLVT